MTEAERERLLDLPHLPRVLLKAIEEGLDNAAAAAECRAVLPEGEPDVPAEFAAEFRRYWGLPSPFQARAELLAAGNAN